MTLLGFETLPGETVRAGDRVGASVIWQAGENPLPADLKMSLTAKAKEGDAEWLLSTPADLAGDGYPTSAWQPGEVLRGRLLARIPPSLEPGLYELELHLAAIDNPGPELLTLPVGDFQVEGWPRMFEPPRPQVKLGTDFAGQAILVGLDAGAAQVSPGDSLAVRLHWRVEAEFDDNYTAFFHLVGPDGLLYGQVDHTPGAGIFPNTGWLPGEYIADEYAIPLADNAPPGNYQLEIGMYDPNTGQRLAVTPPDCQAGDWQYSDDQGLFPGLTVN